MVAAFVFSAFLALSAGFSQAAEKSVVEIVTKTGVHSFSVEVVDNDADRAKGLMHRRSLPEGTGMLFDFHREQDVSFWMQNTYIPLDMIFIRADGRIHRIAENTVPLSLEQVPSRGPVRGVLEVIAGTSRKLGIAPVTGSRTRFSAAASELAGFLRSVYRLPARRGVAQPGSASALGAEGRRFESCRPDQPCAAMKVYRGVIWNMPPPSIAVPISPNARPATRICHAA